MRSFKALIAEAERVTYKVTHRTSNESAKSIMAGGWKIMPPNGPRLIPASISFAPRGKAWVYGVARLDSELLVHPSLVREYSAERFDALAGVNDGPLEAGAALSTKCISDGIQLLIMRDVPGIGDEYCVFDPSVVFNTHIVE